MARAGRGAPSSAGSSRPAHVPTQRAMKERATANLKRSTSWHASNGARHSEIATQPEMTGAPQREKACAARSERFIGGPPASACWYERRTSAVGGVMSAGVMDARSASVEPSAQRHATRHAVSEAVAPRSVRAARPTSCIFCVSSSSTSNARQAARTEPSTASLGSCCCPCIHTQIPPALGIATPGPPPPPPPLPPTPPPPPPSMMASASRSQLQLEGHREEVKRATRKPHVRLPARAIWRPRHRAALGLGVGLPGGCVEKGLERDQRAGGRGLDLERHRRRARGGSHGVGGAVGVRLAARGIGEPCAEVIDETVHL
eukprot:scaffold72626_cov61-Phaeocystis_antarctica.AAC.1